MTKRFVIIDGNSLLFRAYYATAYAGVENIMRTSSGIPTNAIFAFSNMMVRIINDLKDDDHIFVAFDTGEKTFRHDEYEDYKAGRQKVPDELITQFPIAREFLDAIAIKHHEINGFEADDIAGSLAKKAAAEGYEVELYTSDHDYLQLIDERIVVKLIKKGLSDVLTLTPEMLVEQFGFHPYQVSDYKGLTGDASDNLKGIPGVGKVTAIKLLNEYDSLEGIIENAASIKGKLGENIREHIDVAKKSKYLATIITDVEINKPLSYFHYTGFDIATLQQFTAKYELKQLINNIKYKPKKDTAERESVEVKDIASLSKITDCQELSFYVTATEGPYFTAKPLDLYINLDNDIFKIPFSEIINNTQLLAVFENPDIKKYTYDSKRAAVLFKNNQVNLKGELIDVALVTYLTDSNINDTLQGFLMHYGYSADNEDDLYLTLVFKIKEMYQKGFQKLVDDDLLKLYEEIEKPLTDVLIQMEINGFDVNKKILEDIGNTYREKTEELTAQIYELAGHEFNINSPQQVATVLFDELNLPTNKKRSTAVDILNSLEKLHPIVKYLLEYRKYQKIISTYIEGLIPHICEDGKIHTSFSQFLTTTGRLSSNNPNLQNISIRNEEGREIRKAFYAKDNLILSIDYSQIELRLLACIADAKPLIDVFNEDRDIHSETASRLFPLEDEDYARRKAKAVNFGIVYGISDFGLSEQLEVSVGEARSIISAFFKNYPEIWEYRQKIINDVQTNGYVTTITGRKRYLPQINDANYQTREFAKRAAMNAPIQGSAADLIKLAMIKVNDYLVKKKAKTKLILQIHDELIFALDKNEERLIPEIVNIMENIFNLPLKLKVGVSLGDDWFETS